MKNIRILRKKSGMTQAELATRLHVHQTAVSQWEKGRTVPDIEQMKEMSVLFEVSMECIADIQAIPLDETEKPAESGEPSENVIIYHRDGKNVKREFTKEQMDMLVSMIEAIPEKPKDI